ncbi:hypothetical protein PHLCEN_2v6972 [Hermanssonia centrifuga]|uniref:Uncharacterized protein n=1 Tax=Hermanssonia centrifuga TaxID=98765 RepID=A0A2R6NXU5_9APHY|nr:hypothetical protein PHLCEN_2v6972 [Hermanssonia centrifuga]
MDGYNDTFPPTFLEGGLRRPWFMSPRSQLVFVHALFDVTMIVPTTVTVVVGVALRAHTGLRRYTSTQHLVESEFDNDGAGEDGE